MYKPLQERLSGPNDFQLSLAADELELSRLTGSFTAARQEIGCQSADEQDGF